MRTILCLFMLFAFFSVKAQVPSLAFHTSNVETNSDADNADFNTGFMLRKEDNKPIMLESSANYKFLYARFLGEGEATVKVRDANGITVKQFKIKLTGITNSTINIGSLPMGKYFLQLSYKNKRFIHPFVKLREV